MVEVSVTSEKRIPFGGARSAQKTHNDPDNAASTHQTRRVCPSRQAKHQEGQTYKRPEQIHRHTEPASERQGGGQRRAEGLLDKLSQRTTSLRGLNDSTTPPLRHQRKTCRASQEQSRQTKDTQIHVHPPTPPPHFNRSDGTGGSFSRVFLTLQHTFTWIYGEDEKIGLISIKGDSVGLELFEGLWRDPDVDPPCG